MTKRATGWVAPKDQYAVPVMFNPYTGEPRDVRDVQSDPQGVLIVPPGKVEMLAALPTQAADSVLEDAARYRWLRDEGFTFADVDLGTDSDGDDFVAYRIRFHLPEPAHSKFEDDEWTGPDIDAAIDAARKEMQ